MSHRGYDIGDQVTLRFIFVNANGQLADTTVTVRLRTPAGVITSPVPTRVALGTYDLPLALNAAGKWSWRAEGIGAVIAAVEDELVVRRSAFYP